MDEATTILMETRSLATSGEESGSQERLTPSNMTMMKSSQLRLRRSYAENGDDDSDNDDDEVIPVYRNHHDDDDGDDDGDDDEDSTDEEQEFGSYSEDDDYDY